VLSVFWPVKLDSQVFNCSLVWI